VSVALSVRGLSAGYGAIRVLDGIDLDVPAGRITAVIGANGAGKTTLLKALSGLIPRSGDVRLDGVPLPADPAAIVARGIGHVAEGRELFAQMTVAENLELGGWRLPRRERPARIDAVMALFPRLGERRRQLAGSMSGGEQQMLAIARSLLAKPRLLLLDEPSLGLAPLVVKQVYDAIEELRRGGVTILIVEQSVGRALKVADRTYVLNSGAVTISGRSSELHGTAAFDTAYFGAMSGARAP
jgi:branched-chain amino acid transport system ATP-binding protein